jgi:DNA-binding transcriptional ArsR family regulator
MKSDSALSLLAALAQETRLDIFRLLVRAGCDGLAAGAIAAELRVPAATLSFHLKELKSAGAISCTRRGRSLVYRPDFAVMGDLVNFLTAHCCEGLEVTATA